MALEQKALIPSQAGQASRAFPHLGLLISFLRRISEDGAKPSFELILPDDGTDLKYSDDYPRLLLLFSRRLKNFCEKGLSRTPSAHRGKRFVKNAGFWVTRPRRCKGMH